MGEKGEGSGGEGGGNWGERGRELGIGYPPVHPLHYRAFTLHFQLHPIKSLIFCYIVSFYNCYMNI